MDIKLACMQRTIKVYGILGKIQLFWTLVQFVVTWLSAPYLSFMGVKSRKHHQILTGTGRMRSEFPARSAIWRYRGTSFSAAAALQTARETPSMALAPNLAEDFAKLISKQHNQKLQPKIFDPKILPASSCPTASATHLAWDSLPGFDSSF